MVNRKWHSALFIGLVLLLLISTIACTNLLPFPPPVRPSRGFQVQVDFVPSKTVYMPGEKIYLELILTNNSTEPVIVTVPPKVSIYVPTAESETGTVVHIFPAGAEQKQMAVAEIVKYNLTWDQKDESGKQVAPGWYFVEEMLHMQNPEEPEMEWESGGTASLFLIQYPQGAVQKTIELNQSQTINGFPLEVNGNIRWVHLVLTLNSVVLTEMGASFYATTVSPDNPVAGYAGPEWLTGSVDARYVIDDVAKYPRAPNMRWSDTEIELIWGGPRNYLDPVPRDARQLSFIITSFGNWKGYLEFPIPLY